MIKRFTEVKQNGSDAQSIPIGTSADYITLSDGSILQETLGETNLAENGSIVDQFKNINQTIGSLGSIYAPIDNPTFTGTTTINGTLSATSLTGNLPINGTLVFQGNTSNRTIQFGCYTDSGSVTTNFQIRPSSTLTGIYLKGFGNNTNAITIANDGSNILTTTLELNAPNVPSIVTNIHCARDIYNAVGKYFTESNRNINFVTLSGYLPGAFVGGAVPQNTSTAWGMAKFYTQTVTDPNTQEGYMMDVIFMRGQILYRTIAYVISPTSAIRFKTYEIGSNLIQPSNGGSGYQKVDSNLN